MASDQQKREQLLKFLDEKAFDPILRSSPEKVKDDNQRAKLEDVKRSTENEKRRFHDHYRSARDVRDNYLSDLSSDVGKRKSKELQELDLPYLGQFRDEFMGLCDRLGV